VLIADELTRRSDRFIARRMKQAEFRDRDKRLDSFDFDFNRKMNRKLVFELATGQFVDRHEDALFLGPPGTGKSHLAQAIGHAVIQAQGHRILYREAHQLLAELADAALLDDRKALLERLSTVPLLIVDDLGMRKLPHTAAEDLLELVMRRYERASTIITSNRPARIGASCSGTLPRSPQCSTAFCITRMCSNAGRGAGAPKTKSPRPLNERATKTRPIAICRHWHTGKPLLASWTTLAFRAVFLRRARPERLRSCLCLTDGTPAAFPGDGFVRVAQPRRSIRVSFGVCTRHESPESVGRVAA